MLYIYAFSSVILVSIVSLVGAFTLSLKESVIRKYIVILVSLAVGALLGDAFIHLLPEAFEESGTLFVSLGVIAGILSFFLFEKVIHWHCHHTNHDNPVCVMIHPVGRMILVSDGIHNFVDGLIIGASYLVSIEIGIATTIAIVLHEIPQEIADFGILIHSGYTAKKALWYNFLSALSAILGTIMALVIAEQTSVLTASLIPFAAGGFIYIAMSDLIPELHKEKEFYRIFPQLLAIIIGVISMLPLSLES